MYTKIAHKKYFNGFLRYFRYIKNSVRNFCAVSDNSLKPFRFPYVAMETAKKISYISHGETWKYMPLFEKIKYQYDQINKKPEYQAYFDKLKSKYLVESVCDCKTPGIKKIFNKVSEFSSEDLISNVFIKSTHGSGNFMLVDESYTVDQIHNKLASWKKKYPSCRFFIEEKVNDLYSGENGYSTTFMIKCIHGKPFAIDVKNNGKSSSYDLKWNKLPIATRKQLPIISRPDCLDKMLYYAEVLSRGLEYVRVDFYIDDENNIVFCEFDFLSNGGFRFYNMETERLFGKLW